MRTTALLLFLVPLGLGCRRLLRCGQRPPHSERFFFAAPCTRSRMSAVGAARSSSLRQCQEYAARRGALAFNFVHRDLLYEGVKNYSGYTCIAFDCPEFDVQLSFDIDTIFDYYTQYARPMPSINATCLPRLGVYLIHKERRNYTDAQEVCESENGVYVTVNIPIGVYRRHWLLALVKGLRYLADISNAPKTIQLAAALSKEHIKRAFIGLSQEQGRFVTSIGWPLDCSPYRAWGPGQPKEGHGCAALGSSGYWHSAPCSRRLPFLCELRPTGPLRPCAHVAWRWRKECREIFRNSFPSYNRWPKCGDPSIDEASFKLPLFKKAKYFENGTFRALEPE